MRYYTSLVLVLLMMSACTPDTGDPVPLSPNDYRKGTEGIKMEFATGAPPNSVLEESPFKIVAELRNKGAYGANLVYLTAGIEGDYMCMAQGDSCIENIQEYNSRASQDNTGEWVYNVNTRSIPHLTGKSPGSPNGGYDTITFDLRSKKAGVQTTKHTSLIILTACYQYSTELIDDICIDPDPYATTVQKACKIKEETYSDQGAPIAVKKVETIINPGQPPEFIIHIKNAGKGNVLKQDKIGDSCTGKNVPREDWNIVAIGEVTLGDATLKCNDEKPVKLVTGEGKFRCTLPTAIPKETPAYLTKIKISLAYGYTDSISKEIAIERKI